MISTRNIVLAALVTLCTFCAIVYSSCTKNGDSKNACDYISCLNGGTCNMGACTCPPGYSGVKCQTHTILPVCPTGYIGNFCETRAFIGTWNGSNTCTTSGGGAVTISLYNSGGSSNNVSINIYGSGSSYSLSGVISTDAKTITYTNQVKYTGGPYYDTLNGSITLTDNTHFTYSYSVKNGVVNYCNGTFEKQ